MDVFEFHFKNLCNISCASNFQWLRPCMPVALPFRDIWTIEKRIDSKMRKHKYLQISPGSTKNNIYD